MRRAKNWPPLTSRRDPHCPVFGSHLVKQVRPLSVSPMAAAATVFALSSAPGKAAVAVIRITGPAALSVVSTLAGGPAPPRRAVLRKLRHPASGEILDQALVLAFPGPASATGEDLAELHVHGGRAVLQAVFDVLADQSGCRPAEPGEFARRGFENGKLDLTTVEGIADLIDAETQGQRRQALRQADGQLARLYDGWRSSIIEAQALVEAAIDFSDEADVADDAIGRAVEVVRQLLPDLQRHLAGARGGEIVRAGFRVVIAGPPNAGKSTLLNALARRDVAIVSPEAGTTRDVLEVSLDLNGLAVHVSDTAGLRETKNVVEIEGIRRATERAKLADLIIWMDAVDQRSDLPPELAVDPSIPILRVTNKTDLGAHTEMPASEGVTQNRLQAALAIGRGLDQILEAILAEAMRAAGTIDQVVPTTARHRHQLQQASAHLQSFLAAPPGHPELAAESLRLAARAIGSLTGRVDVEDVLDQIFSRFCIGK